MHSTEPNSFDRVRTGILPVRRSDSRPMDCIYCSPEIGIEVIDKNFLRLIELLYYVTNTVQTLPIDSDRFKRPLIWHIVCISVGPDVGPNVGPNVGPDIRPNVRPNRTYLWIYRLTIRLTNRLNHSWNTSVSIGLSSLWIIARESNDGIPHIIGRFSGHWIWSNRCRVVLRCWVLLE